MSSYNTKTPSIEGSVFARGIEYAIRDVIIPARALERQGTDILKLNIGDPVAYDHDTPEPIKKAYSKAIMSGKNGYSSSEGVPELIEAITGRENHLGKSITPDDIIVTTGVTEALQILFGSTINPGDEILVPGPTYPPYLTYPRFFNGRPVEYRTIEDDGWIPDMDDLRSLITPKTKALCVINPNNPTGALYPRKILKQLTDLVGEHDNMYMISDEIYDTLTYDDLDDDPALTAPSPRQVAKDVPMVLLNGISKAYIAPGWRIGYMAFCDETGKMDIIRDNCHKQARARLCANTPGQYAYAEALTNDTIGGYITDFRRKLRDRRDLCLKRFNEIEGLSCACPGGAFYMFPKIEADHLRDDKQFVLDLLNEAHILTVHGSGFSTQYGTGHFRTVFLPPPETLDDAFDRMERFMERHV